MSKCVKSRNSLCKYEGITVEPVALSAACENRDALSLSSRAGDPGSHNHCCRLAIHAPCVGGSSSGHVYVAFVTTWIRQHTGISSTNLAQDLEKKCSVRMTTLWA